MKKIDSIKKKIKYRAEYRGIKEMDLILSGFIKKYLDILNYKELMDLYEILQKDDDVIFKWYSGNNEKKEIGYITSGCFSPVLKKSIGMGYLNNFNNNLDKLYVKVRGDFEEVIINNIPFVKKNYKKGG